MTNVIERAAQKKMQNKLADMKQAQDTLRQAQDDLRQEQQDLKEHTLNRLDAIDEKMEWFLSKGQQGAHPLSDRISQIEQHLEQQNATLARINDVLYVSKRFSIEVFLFSLVFFVPETPDISHIEKKTYAIYILIEEVFKMCWVAVLLYSYELF